MKNTNIIYRKASITISDPWDFGTACGCGPFHGDVVHTSTGDVFVRLNAPLLFSGKRLDYAIISARHVGEELTDGTGTIAANIVLVPSGDKPTNWSILSASKEGVPTIGGFMLED